MLFFHHWWSVLRAGWQGFAGPDLASRPYFGDPCYRWT